MASESLQLYLAGLYLLLYSDNKRGIHLAVAFNIFKSDFNTLCTIGFPQPVISVRSCTVCLLLLLMVYSIFVTLPVFLRGGVFPYALLQVCPHEISKVICILKPVLHFGDICLVLVTLKYLVVSFWTQNKSVLLSAAPPIHLTFPLFHCPIVHWLVLIVCGHFVNDVITLKLCDKICNPVRFHQISIFFRYHC